MSVQAKHKQSYSRRSKVPPAQEYGSQMAPMPTMDYTQGSIQNMEPIKQTNSVMMEATGIMGDNIFRGSMAEATLKTSSIQNLPCGTCMNFVSTIPVESKFPICSIPPCGLFGCLVILNKCDPWLKRLEHICPNCGTILMVCNKPFVQKPTCCRPRIMMFKWHRAVPSHIHDKSRWDNFEENMGILDDGDNA